MPLGGGLTIGATILGPILGSVIGQIVSGDKQKQAQDATKQALATIQAVGAGPDLAKKILLQQYQQAGVYTPQLETAITQATSKVADMQAQSPQLAAAQQGALQAFQQLGQSGLSATDRANLAQIQQQVQSQQQGALGAIQQNMQARGMGGSGADLAAQLSAAQGANNLASNQALQVGSQAQQARMQALQQQAGLAGQMTGQQFQMNLTKAQAADELAKFNIAQQTAAQNQNTAYTNQAKQENLANAQNIANMNTAGYNAEQAREVAAQQQMYANQLGYAGMQANALNGAANTYATQANNQAQGFANMGSAIGAGAGAIGSARGDSVFGKMFNAAANPLKPASTQPSGTGYENPDINNILSGQNSSSMP